MIHRISGLKMPEDELECFDTSCIDCAFAYTKKSKHMGALAQPVCLLFRV